MKAYLTDQGRLREVSRLGVEVGLREGCEIWVLILMLTLTPLDPRSYMVLLTDVEVGCCSAYLPNIDVYCIRRTYLSHPSFRQGNFPSNAL